jgi:hypothetical protein
MPVCPGVSERYGAPEGQQAAGLVAVVPARLTGQTGFALAIAPGYGEAAASHFEMAALGLPCRQGFVEYRGDAR